MKSRFAFIIIFLIIQVSTTLSQVRSLDYFIQEGLSNSPLLKDLDNRMQSNSLDSMLVKAQRVPRIDYNGLLSYAPVINGYGYSEAITNGGNFISTVNLSQSLFNSKTIDANFMKLGIEKKALVNSSRLSENELKKEITNQYLIACSINSQITSSKAIVNSLQEQEAILRQLAQNGIYRQTDYLNFKVELQARRILLNEMRIQYSREISALNNLCGLSDTTIYDLSLPELTVNFPVSSSASTHFLGFRFDSLSIQNERLLLDRSYKPVVNWFADAGLVNNQPEMIYKNFGASIGFSLSLPVYDGNQRKLNYEKLRNSEATRHSYEKTFGNHYNEQVRQLMKELEMTKEMIPQIREELELASMIIRQDKDLLNSGGISITEYLLAVRNYIDIQQYLNQYEVKILQIINEINYWRQ
jgi:outer membrane protein TolC